MKSVVFFLAITRLASGLATANAATIAPDRVRGRDGAAFGDEGVRFTCDRRQIREIKSGMGAYLRSLDIPEEAVLLRERPTQGVLVYTLATPAQETSTLDLATRPAMGITDQVSLPLSSGSVAQVTTVSQKEIVLALLQHGRLTELKGAACSVDALADHVALRQNIVAWAETLRWGWPDGGPAQWNNDYWSRGTPKRGVSLRDAVDDAFVNQNAYAIGCYTATKLVFVKGVMDYYDRVRESPTLARLIQARLFSDRDPLSDIEPSKAWSFYPDFNPKDARPGKLLSIIHEVSPKNFVPGDWVYFLNPDPVSSQKVGYEGSNAIYLGGGRFDDYYGENNHAFTYAEKLDEVFQWRYGVFSRPRDVGKRQPVTEQDLESLGAPPRHGGIVTDWRIGPDFFSVPVRHNTASRQQTPLDRS
jgi:hypothetical protein